MKVKKCTMDDLDELALWEMQATVDMQEGSYWGKTEESAELLAETRELMEHYLTDGKYEVYQFLEEGAPVGHAVVGTEQKYPGAEVQSFSILREHRRKHYGTQALHALMEHLGVEGLDLDVFRWNERAIRFYRSFGFKEVYLHMSYGA